MEEEMSSPKEVQKSVLSEHQEWLISFSKFSYDAYAKVDSINERVRTLTPLMTALGAGYIYEFTRYYYANSASDTLLFYLPLGIGGLCVIVAIFFMLWALVVKHGTSLLAEPNDILEAMPHDKNLTLWQIEEQAIKKRCCAATTNLKSMKQRGGLLTIGAVLAITAFSLLILATPKFIHNQLTSKTAAKNEQR
jgi:hypothetical protein